MFITDDPVADYHRYDAERHKKMEHLPECSWCGEYIQQDEAVLIRDRWYCDDCLRELRTPIGD